MRRLSGERRRIVALSGSVAALSGVVPPLLGHHPVLRWAWVGFMVSLLVYVVVLMVRLRRNEVCGVGVRAGGDR